MAITLFGTPFAHTSAGYTYPVRKISKEIFRTGICLLGVDSAAGLFEVGPGRPQLF